MDITLSPNQIAYKNRPFVGEENSGDKIVVRHCEHFILLAVIDGLGHGSEAHYMSNVIAKKLSALDEYSSPDNMLIELNKDCIPSISAAVGLGVIDKVAQTFTFSAIGNISAYILSHETYSYVSRDGNIGGNMRKPYSQVKALNAGDLLILHSDGIMSRFYTQYEHAILKHSPEVILNYIFTHFEKYHDDASCIVFRY